MAFGIHGLMFYLKVTHWISGTSRERRERCVSQDLYLLPRDPCLRSLLHCTNTWHSKKMEKRKWHSMNFRPREYTNQEVKEITTLPTSLYSSTVQGVVLS